MSWYIISEDVWRRLSHSSEGIGEPGNFRMEGSCVMFSENSLLAHVVIAKTAVSDVNQLRNFHFIDILQIRTFS